MTRNASQRLISALAFLLLIGVSPVFAQTSAFTYQGKIEVSGTPATGAYDLQFKVFNALANGVQQGSTITLDDVPVTNGIFTVSLDFGVGVFPGADRFLEVGIRVGSENGAFTTLAPRQAVASTPYAIKSLNAAAADTLSVACVGCVNSNQISSVAGSTVVGPIPVPSVPPGSPSYIQNTTSVQASSNFNISGNGTAGGTLAANIVNATTQYNIGGNRILSNPGSGNLFAGVGAGTANSGATNTFVGSSAGASNLSGFSNAFFGESAGLSNTTGTFNSFFGKDAGLSNTTGNNNSFFGLSAGRANTTGGANAFFGRGAGQTNTLGSGNSFFGQTAGFGNTAGNANSFFGTGAGFTNTTGINNSFFGNSAGSHNLDGSDNSFFGKDAGLANDTGVSNSFFGSFAGYANTNGSFNTFFGVNTGSANTTGYRNTFFGNLAGFANTEGHENAFFGKDAGTANTTGHGNTFIGYRAGETNITGITNTVIGTFADVGSPNLEHATAIGAEAVALKSGSIVLGRSNGQDEVIIYGKATVFDSLKIGLLTNGGFTDLCRNAANEVSLCSSSRRYKTDITPFVSGLDLINRLRPVTFTWKSNGQRDLGFIAEEVNEVEPLLNTYNQNGQIEGVKYAQITTALVNAIKEQQTQIEKQDKQNRQLHEQVQQQQAQLEALKAVVCAANPTAAVCRPTLRDDGSASNK